MQDMHLTPSPGNLAAARKRVNQINLVAQARTRSAMNVEAS